MLTKPLNQITVKDVEKEIKVKLLKDGQTLNYVFGWLKGINEDSHFTNKGIEELGEYAIMQSIFGIKEDKAELMMYPK